MIIMLTFFTGSLCVIVSRWSEYESLLSYFVVF